jgi:hypothetical protein
MQSHRIERDAEQAGRHPLAMHVRVRVCVCVRVRVQALPPAPTLLRWVGGCSCRRRCGR